MACFVLSCSINGSHNTGKPACALSTFQVLGMCGYKMLRVFTPVFKHLRYAGRKFSQRYHF